MVIFEVLDHLTTYDEDGPANHRAVVDSCKRRRANIGESPARKSRPEKEKQTFRKSELEVPANPIGGADMVR